MIKRLAILAIIALACVGFTTGTASASNCSTYGMTPTSWQADGNWLNFYGYLYGCTDVDMVELFRSTNNQYVYTGWRDNTTGGIIVADGAVSNPDYKCGTQYVTFPVSQTCGQTYYHHPWCSGQTHSVYTSLVYRIHSKSQQSWGPVHEFITNSYNIVC